MSGSFSAETFRPYLGEALSLPDGTQLTLASIADGRQGAFTLIITGVAAPVLAEGLHPLTFRDGSVFELYLMPIHTPSAERQDYQIVFN